MTVSDRNPYTGVPLAPDRTRTMPEAFIFDVDGTLADTERDGHRVAFNQAFAGFGLDWYWSEETYGELLAVTGGKERMRHYLHSRKLPQRHDPGLDRLIADLHALKTRNYVELLEQNAIPLRPGIERLLREARGSGIRLAIATTTTPQNVTVLLENALGTDSLGWFDVIGAGDVVPRKKPAPDIYHYVLRELGLGADACLAFEDSANGLIAARGAGLPTIVTRNFYTAADDFSGALLVLDHPGERGNPSRILQKDLRRDCLDLDAIERIASRPR